MKNRIALYFTTPINFLWGILGFLSAIILILFGFYEGTSSGDTLKFCIISLVLLSIIVYYMGSQFVQIGKKPYFNAIIIGSYIISLLMIIAINKPDEILLWMAGGLIISILFDMQLGLLFTYNLIIITSFIGKLNAQSVVFLMILGTLLCMLSGSMKNIASIGYAIIIVLSVQVTLLFIMNNFYIWNTLNIDAVYNLFSLLLTIGVAYLAYFMYQKKFDIENEDSKELEEPMKSQMKDHVEYEMESNVQGQAESHMERQTESHMEGQMESHIEGPMEEPLVRQVDLPGTHSMEEIIDMEFPLLLRLKEQSKALYENSLHIGQICQEAAKAIGVRDTVAKAGGIYYNIGHLESRQYVDAGVQLVEDYHMPTIIKDIILQHNLKYDTPKTPEAAIVMLAASIISTKDFLEKKGQKEQTLQKPVSVPMEKIVESVFQLRLSKGSLDDAGLSLGQYNTLKSYFLHM